MSDPAVEAPLPRALPAVKERLHRDGITLTGYLVLSSWGWFLYGFGALLPQLGREQGISRTVTGVHSVLLSAGALLAGLLTIRLVRAVRRRGVLHLGALLLIFGTVLLAVGGTWTWATLAAAAITGTGGSLLVNIATPALSDHHDAHGAAALAEGNAFAASCGLFAPLLVGAGVATGVSWRPAILVTVPLVLGMLFVLRRQGVRTGPGAGTVFDQQLPPARGPAERLPVAVYPAMAMVAICVAVEFCMAAWSADLLREQVGFSAGAAAAGVSAVIGGMTLGRLVTGRLALRHTPSRLLLIAIGVAAIGWTVTWLSVWPWAALAGLLLTGTGIGAHFPLGAQVVFAAAPGRRDQAAGLMSIGVGMSAGGGPFALGALADATSTHTAFLVVPGLLAVAGLLLQFSVRAHRPA